LTRNDQSLELNLIVTRREGGDFARSMKGVRFLAHRFTY